MPKSRFVNGQQSGLIRPGMSPEPPPMEPPVAKPLAERRLGRFRVPQGLLHDPLTARALYRDMIVFRAEANFVDNTLMVWADHPAFEVMDPGVAIPEYVAVVVAPKGMKPRRHQDLVVTWSLEADYRRAPLDDDRPPARCETTDD